MGRDASRGQPNGGRDGSEQRTAALARISGALAGADGTGSDRTDEVLSVVAAEVVNLLADGCHVALLTEDGAGLRTADLRHSEPATEAALREALETATMDTSLLLGEAGLVPAVDSEWLASVSGGADGIALEDLDLESLVHVPLTLHGETTGVIVAMRGRRRPVFSADDIALLDEIGLWAALALAGASSAARRRRAEDRFRRLTDTLPVIVFRMSLWPEFAIEYVSPAAYTILGYTPEEVTADPDLIWLAIHPEDRPIFERLARRPEELSSPFVMRCIHRDGHVVWCESRCSLEHEAGTGRLVAIDGVTSDVTATRDVEAALTRRALHDPLTGLPNLMLFREHLHHAYSRRTVGVASPALVVADIDDFLEVNRERGHAVADRVLAELATRVAAAAGAGVTVGRTGGDEFAFLFEDVHELEQPVRFAEELAEVLAATVEVDDDHVAMTASMGVAYARPDATDSPEDLLKHADAALESARRKGGDRYEVFDRDLRERVGRRLRTEADLRRALERDEFTLVYQPEVLLGTGETVAVEALLRWRHPERGLLEPQDFLQAAEDSGLMVPIGAWVLEQACRTQADWARRRRGRTAPAVVVNLSPRQIGDPDIVSDVAGVMARTGVDPGALCLDVTEAALADDPVTALAVLQAFRRLGIRVAVDDFGTGYASLSIVRTYPVDAVKIDDSVVAALDGDPAAAGFCSAVVELAAGCGLDVSAEGVETASQRDRLMALGATRGQGDLFRAASRPEELGLTLSLVE